jgi:hypothetical protein
MNQYGTDLVLVRGIWQKVGVSQYAGHMSGDLFISYSRKEFYFTEWLVLSLKSRGIGTWFDVHSLKSGTDWTASIQIGLEACSGLLLVASRSSLASAHVSKEWRQVVAAKKRIFVVVFEAVEMPPELQDATVVDFRGNFDRKLDLLTDCLRSGISTEDSMPKPHKSWLPHMTPFISFVASSLFATALVSALVSILFFFELGMEYDHYLRMGENPALLFFTITALSVPIEIAFTFKKFAHREAHPGFGSLFLFALSVIVSAQWNLLGQASDYFVHDGSFASAGVPRHGPYAWLLLPLIIIGLSNWCASFMLLFSRDFLLWKQTGDAPEWFRRRILQHLLPTVATESRFPSNTNKSYSLHYNEPDGTVADEVKKAMDLYSYSHSLETDHSREVDVRIAIVSDGTRKSWLEDELLSRGGRLVCVVASSIEIPSDERWFHLYQWVDYRKRDFAALTRVAKTLSTSTANEASSDLPIVPETLSRVVLPTKLLNVHYLFMGTVGLGIGYLLRALFFSNGSDALAIVQTVTFALITTVSMVWLRTVLLTRKTTYKIFLLVCITSVVLLIFSGLYKDVQIFFRATVLLHDPGMLQELLTFAAPVPWLVWALIYSRNWLPAKATFSRKNGENALKTPKASFKISELLSAITTAGLVMYLPTMTLPIVKSMDSIEGRMRADAFLQKLELEVLKIPEMRAMLEGVASHDKPFGLSNESKVVRSAIALAQSGWQRVDGDVLETRARLITKLLERMDIETCGRYALGPADERLLEKVITTLNQIGNGSADLLVYLTVKAISAALKGEPQDPVSAEQYSSVLQRLIQTLSPPDKERFNKIAENIGNSSYEEACWFLRNVYGQSPKLTNEDRLILLRSLAQAAF